MKAKLFRLRLIRKLKGMWLVLRGWPMYRVTYKDGQRTRPLGYAEAKGCADVFGGKLWVDYKLVKRWWV